MDTDEIVAGRARRNAARAGNVGGEYGADGLVSGRASVFPHLFVRLYNAVKDRNYTEAEQAQQQIIRISSICDNAWIRVFKYALKKMHICEENIAMPFDPLNPKLRKRATKLFRELKIT